MKCTLTETAQPTVWGGRANAEPFRMRCTSDVLPTPAKSTNFKKNKKIHRQCSSSEEKTKWRGTVI